MAQLCTLNQYLLVMVQEHLEFRLPGEIKSLLSLCEGQFISSQNIYGKSPFWILSLPSEDIARNLMKRTVCAFQSHIKALDDNGKGEEI
uniref:tRNA (guanine(10)-N(2))-methyltransferase TRMT11 N-terminal domain-containing protein n=1 Tax=Sciurus vulgaris TaxID=55149 RepID=A0A8D2B1Q9_SCIVU